MQRRGRGEIKREKDWLGAESKDQALGSSTNICIGRRVIALFLQSMGDQKKEKAMEGSQHY